MQEYLASGFCSVKLARIIFKARSLTLDIKSQRKWKFTDKWCVGCHIREETGQEILICEKLNFENSEAEDQINYDAFYSNDIKKIVTAGKLIENGLRKRTKILETGIT